MDNVPDLLWGDFSVFVRELLLDVHCFLAVKAHGLLLHLQDDILCEYDAS